MGYDLAKRLSLLKRQVDENQKGRVGFGRAFFCSFALLFALALIISSLGGSARELSEEEAKDPVKVWTTELGREFNERVEWMDAHPFIVLPLSADLYVGFGKAVAETLMVKSRPKPKGAEAAIIDVRGWIDWFKMKVVSTLLRIGFVFFVCLPWWLISVAAGYFAFRGSFRPKRTEDILGVCDRGHGPFYSGIYGPFRPNNSFSGTDLSAPNLACPAMADPNVTLKHQLVTSLKEFDAFNQTNFELVRVILSYKDFPGLVDSEQSWEEDDNSDDTTDELERMPVSQTGFVTGDRGTLEQSALEGLPAVLEAHRALVHYVKELERHNIAPAALNANFSGHAANLAKITETLSPLAKLLVYALTPNRALAIGHLPAHMIATAYLAIEAGKCLVFKRSGKAFMRISHFPHLQARAIVHSLVPFHKEHNGDQRLIIRQAIICCRRHGDFGTAFLPIRMPVESRAMRDWLEIMYSDRTMRDGIGYLVELDAHIEEISVNWRNGFGRRVRAEAETPTDKSLAKNPGQRFWKGISHKSVVLVPLTELVPIALRGMDNGRLTRILELIKLTRKYQTSLSISARLPGFKRQAVEANKQGADSFSLSGSESYDRDLLERWTIVRRMLTRYNWLSTRVGDDAVPSEGFVQGIVYNSRPGFERIEVLGLDALVPLRQRRFEELFGKSWERVFYDDSPHHGSVQVFVERAEYAETLKDAITRAELGTLQPTVPHKSPSSAFG